MSDTALIISATGLIIAYLGLTYLFRRKAEDLRLRSLLLARKIQRDERTPEEVRQFLAKEDYIGAKGYVAWLIVAMLPFLAIAAVFSRKDDHLIGAAEVAGNDVSSMFNEYIDVTAKSSLLRSPLATLIVAFEIPFFLLIATLLQIILGGAATGVRSIFAYTFIRMDEAHEHGWLRTSLRT